MKELRDNDRDTSTRQPGGVHLSAEKLLQERSLVQQLVSSSVSPSYESLSLLNSPAMEVYGANPAMFSAHLIASLAAANSNARIPIPLPIPLGIPASAHPLYRGCGVGSPGTVPGLPATLIPNAQLDILSSWVKEQSSKQQEAILKNPDNKTTGKNKDSSNNKWSVKKANKRNKASVGHGMISSENDVNIKKEKDKDQGIKSALISKTTKVTTNKKKIKSPTSVANNNNNTNHNNNNNNINNRNASIQQQQSNQVSRDKVFICPICNRCFGYKHVLQNHERTHTGEKPFKCNICQKKFTRDHHLKTHMRLHTGEKPYQCSHCERQFVQVANLRRHLRVHTGERPYACELCSNRFSDSNQLKAHMLIHKGEKPYSCEECGGRFRRRHHLVHHKCSSQEKIAAPAFTHSRPEIIPPASNLHKSERKSTHPRRIVRHPPCMPVTLSSGYIPEQTHPEDLSLSGNGIKSHNYSGSHSSCSISPSGGSNGSLGQYCHSTSSEGPLEYSSDEDVKVKLERDNNGKNGIEGTHASLIQRKS